MALAGSGAEREKQPSDLQGMQACRATRTRSSVSTDDDSITTRQSDAALAHVFATPTVTMTAKTHVSEPPGTAYLKLWSRRTASGKTVV